MKKELLFIFILFGVVSGAQTIPELQKKIQSQKNKDTLTILYDQIATLYAKTGEFDKAIDYQKKGLEITKQLTNPQNLAFSYNNVGTVYMQSGNLNEAIVYYTEALKVLEENNLPNKAALLYTNIGNIYVKLKLYDKALDYYHKGLELKKKLGEKNILPNLYSISNAYRAQTNYKEALKYLNECNALIDTANPAHAKQRTMILNSLGACHRGLEEYQQALYYYTKSEQLTPSNDLARLEPLYGNLAALYVATGEYRKSLAYQFKAYDCAKKMNSPEALLYSYKNFSEVYSSLKISDTARNYFKKYIDLSDSLNKIQNAQYALDLSTKYETEKKEGQIKLLAKDKELQELKIIEQINEINNKEIEAKRKESEIKLLNNEKDLKAIVLQNEIVSKQKKEKENDLLNTENKLSLQTIKQQKTISYFIISALLLASGLAYFIFRGLKIQRRANKIIFEQKQEVVQQKHLVEEKQKEIIDSINYAKRIQTTLLAHTDFVNENISSNFILFKPKDIVSGDFYSATKKDDLFYLAVCDSTGHGVPGAFMSLLNIGFLSEAINEKNIKEPNNVLNYVRERLISTISKEGQQDGFDGILLCVNKKTKQLTYSAAHNAPIIISDSEIIQLDADKMPVGKGEKKEDFKLRTINLKESDTLYLYTDGYADQFGGPKGKKFLYKKLNQLIQSLSNLPLVQQKEKLNEAFENWKGNLEQVDDVLLIGIKI